MFKRLLKSIIGWLREIPPTGYDEILPEPGKGDLLSSQSKD